MALFLLFTFPLPRHKSSSSLLASIHSAMENDHVWNMLVGQGDKAWIG